MAANNQSNALLTEHFRYTPLTLLDDIINVVNEVVFRAVGALEEGLSAWPAQQLGFRLEKAQAASLTSEDARDEALEVLKQNEADNGIVKLESLLNATVDKDFDKFEIYTLRNILAVGHEEEDLASWVRLDHYKGIDAAAAASAPQPEDVQHQRRKLHETAKLNVFLKAEEARNTAVLSQLTSLLNPSSPAPQSSTEPPPSLAFLHTVAQSSRPSSLTTDTRNALEQLPALQSLITQLKAAMQTVPSSRGQLDDEDSVEARRRKYLHSQSLRALERRGIDPDASAGASLTAGPRLERDEVEGIERVVQALSSDGVRGRQGR